MQRRRQILPLNALRAFEAAARLGRATAAAQELGVTHGAISRQIAHLEQLLGVRLFAGTRGQPRLSETGRQLAACLTPAFDQIEEAVRPFYSRDDGLLQVASLSSFAVRWIIPRLHRFSQRHPGIDVRLGTSADRLDERRGSFDLAITVLEDETSLRPGDRLLFQEELGLVIAPGLLAGDGGVPDPRLRRLVASTRPDAWEEWHAAADTGAARPMPAGAPAMFEHYHFALQAALSGLGACVAPRHLVADDIAAGRLEAPYPFRKTRNCYVLRIMDSRDRKAAKFAAWLEEELRESALMPIIPA
ncbi:LysR substrate-binding domain-containing protein [Radicibacter daui]|uniref:LysR substrate-binding domain-containing protein n=1 Tax=Radicibacter daui TaxID=3064829 RepID=UPI004046A971